MKKCGICQRSDRYSYFTIDIPYDDAVDIDLQVTICGACWDIIAAVAVKAIEAKQEAG